MRIATWNVNSIRQRLDNVLAWVRDRQPDILCLQEIKCLDEAFPREAFEDAGYNVAVHGQKTFNGVALLSRLPFDEVSTGLPGDEDDAQARFIEGVVSTKAGVVRVASLYLPNGNPVGTDKFAYKLAWMDRLHAHAAARLADEEPYVLAGDYNVIPEPQDVYAPEAWVDDALFRIESRRKLRRLLHVGYTDAFRACHAEPNRYSFWDYTAGAFQKNRGLRIDHILLSLQAADPLAACDIDKAPRGWEKPSDHVPVWAELNIPT